MGRLRALIREAMQIVQAAPNPDPSCPECRGTGIYTGLGTREPCSLCTKRGVGVGTKKAPVNAMLSMPKLMLVGHDPAGVPERLPTTTASGVEYVPRLTINRLDVLGQQRTDFPVLAHTLPPSAGVDGLLGLDFFRGRKLTLDFRTGVITLD